MRKLALLSLFVLGAYAQSPNTLVQGPEPATSGSSDFSADRPGIWVTTDVLPGGVTQSESGFAFTTAGTGGQTQHDLTLGSSLLRFGLGMNTELRVGGNGYAINNSTEEGTTQHQAGWADMSLGVKVKITSQKGLFPALSVLSSLSLPTGAKALGSGTYDPSFGILWTENLPKQFSYAGTYLLSSVADDSSRLLTHSTAMSIGHPIYKGLAGYSEVVYDTAQTVDGRPFWVFDGGISCTVHNRAQFDVEAGRQFAGIGNSFFVSFGVAYRYDRGFAQSLLKRHNR